MSRDRYSVMINKEKLKSFSEKWIEKFMDPNINYLELVEHELGEDCFTLGFEMDCGRAFVEAYGDAFNDFETLEKVIDNVMDVYLLGSAIYSKWRYYNHWAYSGSEILEPENRAWFVLVLERLSELA